MILGVQLYLLTKSLFTKEEFNINFWKWFSHSNGLLYCREQFNKKGSTNNALTHYQIQIPIISFQLQLRSGWRLKHARNVEKWIWNHNETSVYIMQLVSINGKKKVKKKKAKFLKKVQTAPTYPSSFINKHSINMHVNKNWQKHISMSQYVIWTYLGHF